ncbi:MAG: molybdopterin molybdotransferase MoeA [Bacteroidetes bacterium]|nr:molybdopterin molybdotransferase MoeA [Bacteroidota bacterium]
MIDVSTAQKLVMSHCSINNKSVEVSLHDASDYVLAENVISKIDMPPFRQSAMDGYALHVGDTSTYRLVGEVKAGDNSNLKLNTGEAVRIFTGAAVPDTANTVIMQEKVIVKGGLITIEGALQTNLNIRPKAEQIKIDDIALTKGTTIKGAHIGFLASLGVTAITVYEKPSIAIVVTGNELVIPGNPLSFGEIYESNGAMLAAVLRELGYKSVSVLTVKDDYQCTKKTLKDTIENYDLTIVTGGVSVGDYDFVGKALNDLKVEEIFYKVKQKPGKPLFFGKKGSASIFGLPGNPAAALSCFYMYVYSHLKKMEGAINTNLLSISMPLVSDYTVKGDRAQFLKAKIVDGGVEVLGGQSSAMLRTFGEANALVFLPEGTKHISKDQHVKTIVLPTK